jgi:hypothetical protein
MALPSQLEKPIDEIKTPSNRVLVISLIFAVISLVGGIVHLESKNRFQSEVLIKKCYDENENLKKQLNENLIREREYFQRKLEIQDSSKNNLQKILNK